MPDTLRNNSRPLRVGFADVVLNAFALLLLMFFWITPISAIVGVVVGMARRGETTFDTELIFLISFSLFLPAIFALFPFYLAKKICERRRWSILLSALITGVPSALLIIFSLQIGVATHPGMFTTGLVGMIITIILLSVGLLPRTNLRQQP